MSRCDEIRTAIQDRVDGPVELERHRAIETHLDACGACRDYEDEIRAVALALRRLPADAPLAQEDLEAIWRRTSRSAPRRAEPRAWRLGWGLAAAAASLLIASLLFLQRPVPEPFSQAELARAERDARTAIVLAGRAFRRTEQAMGQVLASEASPAMRRIPVRWPQSDSVPVRRGRS